MLQQLAKYAESVGIVSEPGFKTKKVHWAINVSAQGRFLGLEDLRVGKNGKEFPGCPDLLQSELVSGGQPRSHYLVESAGLLLEYSKKTETDPKKIERQRKKREFFLRLLELSSGSVAQLSWLRGAPLFLQASSEIELARAEAIKLKATPNDSVVVVVESRNPLETLDWQDWWRAYRASFPTKPSKKTKTKPAASDDTLVRDLLTGKLVKPMASHPKVRGLSQIGGLSTGDALISFDKAAFQSYGLKKSENAALSAESASCYVAALEDLISRGKQLANTQICYWYSGSGNDDLFGILLDPEGRIAGDSTDVNSLVQAIRVGIRPNSVADRFYYLSVSGCSGRVMVRDWCEGSFERLQQAVSAWFTDLSIVRLDGKALAPPPKFWTVLTSLFRIPKKEDPKKVIPSPLAQDLFRRAVNASPLPPNILALAINRIRSDLVTSPLPPFNHARMGLIKAYLNRKNGEQFVQTHLREDHPEPAYHCGRLLAVLAQLQQAAIPEVQAGVVQRFYAATSQTPALTMGRLLANAQNHLAKISGGLAHYYNGAISGILNQIDSGFPQTLTLEKQSLFALGYYQQMAEIQRQRAEKRAHKQNKTTRDDEGEFTDEPY